MHIPAIEQFVSQSIMMSKTFPVIEVFGPTIQGEGALAGKPTHFVRMGGCDYRCHWCDSEYAVLPAKVRANKVMLTTREIFGRIMELTPGPEWVTISGGNPALHDLAELVVALHSGKFKVAVETQGTLWKDWLAQVDQLTISPKPPSSQMHQPDDLRDFMGYMMRTSPLQQRVCLKVPVFDDDDYEAALEYHQEFSKIPFYFSVVTKMGGLYGNFADGEIDTRDTLLDRYRWLAEKVSKDPRGSLTTAIPQLHALLWGHGRGF